MTAIRAAQSSDAPGYHACVDAIAREQRYISYEVAPSPAAIAKLIELAMAGELISIVGIDDSGEVVGWCEISPKRRNGQAHVGTLSMGVSEAHRGRGLGRALASAAIAEAHRRGLERIELEVFGSNTNARRLYDWLGFELEGIKRGARKVGQDYDDFVMMALISPTAR